MKSIDRHLACSQRFTILAEAFDFQGSASLSKNEQRIFFTDQSRGFPRQLVVQLNEDPGPDGVVPAVDGIAQNENLLVALLDATHFVDLLELLYESRRQFRTVLIDLESDSSGRIVRFAPRAHDTSEHPPAGDGAFDESERVPA